MSDSSETVWAHKNESVFEHGTDVRNVGRKHLPAALDKNVADIINTLHDLGKCTTWFQDYLKNDELPSPPELKNHALLGACAAMLALRQEGYDAEIQTIGFYAIAKHHGYPGNLTTHSTYTNTDDVSVKQKHQNLISQCQNILGNDKCEAAATKLLGEATSADIQIEHVQLFIERGGLQKILRNEFSVNSETYEKMLQYWSLLTFADKTATIGLSYEYDGSIVSQRITEYIQDELQEEADRGRQSQLNDYRNKARKEALRNVDRLVETGLGRITLPTGFGKTLTGLQTALKRAEQKDGRVVYALPFTTVIDQTDEEIREIFDVEPTDPEYTIHHHLADTRSKAEGLRDFRDQGFRAETWQSQLTLTTFVQLFESLAGPVNSQSVKLPALEDAVIVIDEPQGLTHNWWKLANRLIKLLNEQYNCDVIAMTATQPKLLEQYEYTDNPVDLIPDSDEYFRFLEENPRVEYKLHESVERFIDDSKEEPLVLDEAINEVRTESVGDSLIICNTINQTTEFSRQFNEGADYVSLNQLLHEESKTSHGAWIQNDNLDACKEDLISNIKESKEKTKEQRIDAIVSKARGSNVLSTLTTRIRPQDREVLISAIQRLLSDEETNLKVVSTQLVEAGVDVSFDAVYRDFAPFSSIVQSAGRCNRSFEGDTKQVTIWRLDDSSESRKTPSELVYEQNYDLLNPTRRALKDVGESSIGEYDMVDNGTEKYYEYLHKLSNPGRESFVDAVDQAKFKTLRKASIIPEIQETIDIIVTKSRYENQLVELYHIFREHGKYKKSNLILNALKRFTVSIPVEDGLNIDIVEVSDGLYHLNAVQFESQYILEDATGVTMQNSVDDFFI